MFIKKSIHILMAIVVVLTLSISVSAVLPRGAKDPDEIIADDLIAQAREFGLNITGLSEPEVRDMIRQAETDLHTSSVGNGYEELLSQAKKFSLNITGLTEQEAWDKVRNAERNQRIAEETTRNATLARHLLDE
jgi:post-segregation antitoxin (ccd killing protein)